VAGKFMAANEILKLSGMAAVLTAKKTPAVTPGF
jgi:hypothetical protein